ncbi:MAG: flagellar filament capping protein FliD [Novosphingobium sp.]
MVTTSSTTAASVTQSTVSTLLTSLGTGSGIDMVSLASNLATAQFAAKTDRLTQQAEKLKTQISAASTLRSALSNLASSLGTRVREGDLSAQPKVANGSVASATLSGTSQAKGSYSLEVTSLATAQTLASPAYAASTSTVGAGTLTIRFGATDGGTFTEDTAHAALDITVAAGATLGDVANQINAQNAGVTAYVSNTTDGAKLVLKGATGAANGFVVEAAEDAGDPGLSTLAWNPAPPGSDRLLTSAGNANFKLDGLTVTSATNTVTDAVPGVSLTLTGINSGSPTTVSFSDPTSAITTAMGDLVDALNEIMSEINTATNAKTGDLARDSGALALKRQLQALTTTIIMPNAAEGEPRTLSALGVSLQRDGTFTLDRARLGETLKANPEATGAMFTNGLYGIYATVDSISRNAALSGNPGSLAGSISSMSDRQTKISEEQTKLAEKQEVLRAQLIARFSAADSIVSSSKSTLSFLKNQIAAWNSSGSN